MGGSLGKLRKHLYRGDEYAALQICERHPDLRRSLDPNASYGETYAHHTPLHLASKHAMKALIRIFLQELGGNPNKKTGDDCTSLHLMCQVGSRLSESMERKIRAECLCVLLAWEGGRVGDGTEAEKADLNALDNKKNTALHFAASSGLKRCVEMLVCKGADLTVENEAKETACDAAERCGHHDIAEYLETKMLFSEADTTGDEINEDDVVPVIEQFSGLREQDLIEAKDLLLVETSDMLQVPLFTAEALLRNHEWSRQSLWQSWRRDPVVCCERCGVQPPLSALEAKENSPGPSTSTQHSRFSFQNYDDDLSQDDDFPPDSMCEICADEIEDDIVRNGECGHQFCRLCWKQYATVKIQEGDLHSISCPAFDCSKLVPLELIERVVSPSIARKYLTFDIKAFVESNPRIKWCPFPGCTNAVRLPDSDEETPMYMRVFPKLQPPPPTSKTVCCPHGHDFCWDCSSSGHEPTSCDKWKDWHDKIAIVKPEHLNDTGSSNESAANCLWLVTHSKPCPKCKSPIQKNEGCNHMKCSKCKQDFCWVCLGPWKKHSTETGGYFRCNRYDDSRKVEDKTEEAIAQAKEQSKKAQELNRFVHYYSRYKNHLNSYGMEKTIVDGVDRKVEHFVRCAEMGEGGAGAGESSAGDFSFVREAVEELLRSRKALSSSYAYGYFLKDCGYNKTIFEYLQNELEVSVETLSGLVGRCYLRGSKERIIRADNLVASRRHRFLVCIGRGLVPPETPPALRKNKRRTIPAILGLDKDDEEWVKAGIPPMDEIDPMRPWIRDGKGKHHNLLTILDWPEDEDEETSSQPQTPQVICERKDCSKSKARNTKTGDLHSYCSLKCQYLASALKDEELMGGGGVGEGSSVGSEVEGARTASREYNVDFMIALQMSRLQLLQDLKFIADQDEEEENESCSSSARSSSKRRKRTSLPHATKTATSSSAPDTNNIFLGEDVDPDLQLAIERSVMDISESWVGLSSLGGGEEAGAGVLGVGGEGVDTASVHKILKGITDKSTEKNVLNDADKALALNEDKKVDKVLIPLMKSGGNEAKGKPPINDQPTSS